MAADDIYVQVTANAGGRSRSVIVLVPRTARESVAGANENIVAQKLAEPIASYAFLHRRILADYKVSYAFFTEEPNEIEGRAPQLRQNGLQAWIV